MSCCPSATKCEPCNISPTRKQNYHETQLYLQSDFFAKNHLRLFIFVIHQLWSEITLDFSEITHGRTQGTIWSAELELWWTSCKTSAQPTVLSLQPTMKIFCWYSFCTKGHTQKKSHVYALDSMCSWKFWKLGETE